MKKTSANHFLFRKATKEDIPAVTDLWWEMQKRHVPFDRHYYQNKGLSACKPMARKYFSALAGKPDCLFYVATLSDRLVGFLVAHVLNRPPVYELKRRIGVEVTVVEARYRRQGVFRGMLHNVIALAKARKIKSIELSVDTDNPDRIAYIRAGFHTRQVSMVKWLD